MQMMTATEDIRNTTTERVGTSRTFAIAGAIAVAIVTLVYLFLFWNHFAGLRSGSGEYGGGREWLAGYRPYRDYFTACTPLNILKSALVLSIFGKAYIVTRAAAVFERAVLAVLLYVWLLRLFRVSHAALAAMVTIIICTGDLTDPLGSYNHDAILFAVGAGLLASYALDRQRSSRAITLLAFCSGASAALSFTAKQTIGFSTTVAIAVVVCACLLRLENLRRAGLFLAAFCGGWVIGAGSFVLWLLKLGILSSFLEQIFVRGPAAKASNPADFVVRELVFMQHLWWAVAAAILGIVLCWRLWRRSAAENPRRSISRVQAVTVLFLGFAAIAAGYLASIVQFQYARVVLKPTIYFTFFAVILLCLVYAISLLKGKLSRRESQFFLCAAVGLSVAFMLSLSFPAFEPMVIPGLGLLIGAVLDASTGWRLALAYSACALLIASETCAKLNQPFGFADFNEPPVRMAHATSTLPLMKGFVLPESTVRFIDETTRIIEQNTTPQDTIYSYPEFGLFYALSGRRCPTLTCSHNIDVVNDDFARSEAARILAGRPAVLICHRNPEAYLAGEELIWRHGRPSGNRAIIAAVEKLEKQYRLAASFDLPPDNYQIDVYVRPR